jgi:5-methylcytosine-specific restriction endonuclease McrA
VADGEHNRDRLRALVERASDQSRDAEKRVREELKHLIDLLREAQPIIRTTAWPIQVIIHIAEKQNWRCPAPECPYGDELLRLDTQTHHVDHIIPWCMGGGNETANIQILHATCNLRKGARASIDDVIRYLQGRLRNI